MTAGSAWMEAGQGDAKLLLHVGTNRTRLVMRKDRSVTILLNQLVQPSAELSQAASEDGESARAFIFEAEDFATGVMRRETFAIRFKTDPVAREFKLKYLEAQERNRLVFAAEQAGVRSPAAAVNVAAAAAAAASLAIPASAQRPAVMRSSLLSPTQATIFEEEAEERSRSSASTPRKQVGEASPMRMSALGGAVKGSPRAGSPRASSSAGVGVGSVAGASAPAMAEVGAVGAVVGVDEEAGEADKGGAEEEGSGQRGGGGRGWALPLLALLLLVGGGTAVAYGRVPAVKAAIDGVCGRGAEGTKLLAARLREVASKLPRRA